MTCGCGRRVSQTFDRCTSALGHIGAYDYALFSSIVDHMIAGNALFAQASALQVARYRQEVIEMGAVYAFGCTEINSGSDVRNLQTLSPLIA